MNSIAVIAKKQFHKSFKELHKLFETKHNDFSQLSILINCFNQYGLNYEFLSWEEFAIKGKDKYDLLVVTQKAFLSGKVPSSEIFWQKMNKLRSSGTNILFLHHPAYEFIENNFLDVNVEDYFAAPVLNYKIVPSINDKLVYNIDSIIANGLNAQDEFTYYEKNDSKFKTLIEKIPAKKDIRKPSKYICFGYQNNTPQSKTYFLDIHSVGSSKRLNGKIYEQIIKNLCDSIFSNSLSDDTIIDEIIKSPISETEKKALIDSRLGQGKFRNKLIEYWQGCSVTNIKLIELLKASHIKPWCKSNNQERLDLYNGLLLLPNFDTLFDKGYISFDENGKILLSELLSLEEYKSMGVKPEMKIKINKHHQKYLQYHRDNIYKKSV